MNEALDVLSNGGWVWVIFYNYILIFLSSTDAMSLPMDSVLYLIPNFIMTYSNSCIHSLKEK